MKIQPAVRQMGKMCPILPSKPGLAVTVPNSSSFGASMRRAAVARKSASLTSHRHGSVYQSLTSHVIRFPGRSFPSGFWESGWAAF